LVDVLDFAGCCAIEDCDSRGILAFSQIDEALDAVSGLSASGESKDGQSEEIVRGISKYD